MSIQAIEAVKKMLERVIDIGEAVTSLSEFVKLMDKRIDDLNREISVNRVLITILAKEAGMSEPEFFEQVDLAIEVSKAADEFAEAMKNPDGEVSKILSNMMKGGAREH